MRAGQKGKLIALVLMLALVLTQFMPLHVFAVNTTDGNRPLLRSDIAAYLAEEDMDLLPSGASAPLTQQDAVAAVLKYAGLKESSLGAFPDDYNAMAKSVGLVDETYDPTAEATLDDFAALINKAQPLKEAVGAENPAPYFVNGMAQPIFAYEDVVRFCVYVESNYDTDGDGKLDLVKALVQLPGAVLDGMDVATVFEARPYIAGMNSNSSVPSNMYVEGGFDNSVLYSQPAARVPAGTTTTAAMVENANPDDWYYLYNREWMLEDLPWYDYYLVRGFAVVQSAGIGTLGSEGYSTCGTDLEIDAFKCIIEWLNGERVAYSDKTGNVQIAADWSNGNVGMTGRSYAGTTQFGLATTGVEGLKTIVPVAGIASWYEYTNSQGISTRTKVNYVDGLAWYCNSRFGNDSYGNKEDWALIAERYGKYLAQLRDDQVASNGDYNQEAWAIRDYTLDWANIDCTALIVHGMQDYNVRSKQADLMYQAFAKAGKEAKMLIHQGAHMTPTYPSYEYEMYIDDKLYDEVLNTWFSHYLYGIDNGADEMAAVTAQSNLDGSWEYYDSWESFETFTLQAEGNYVPVAAAPAALTAKTAASVDDGVNYDDMVPDTAGAAASTAGTASVATSVPGEASYENLVSISSDYTLVGGTGNWTQKFSQASTACSAMYAIDVPKDTTIKGTIEVNVKAATSAVGRDALMMSAMLVDISDEAFNAYNTGSGSQVAVNILKEGGAWMGGGVTNYDLAEFKGADVNFKAIARGWIDLYNPTAGYDSYTAADRTELEAGEFYNYKIYLQPNVYTVEEGHTLALVIYTYESGMARYTENYDITIDSTGTYATIPVGYSNKANPDGLYLTTEAYNVTDGDQVVLNAGFTNAVSTNIASLTYSFNADLFDYVSFAAAEGVVVVDEVVDSENGIVELKVMTDGYNAAEYGQLTLNAKEGQTNAFTTVTLAAEYVVKDEAGDKVVRTANTGITFTTKDPNSNIAFDTNGDGIIDLIDLSNMIDVFGDTKAEIGLGVWNQNYAHLDYNNNSEIDINDIAAVAQLIVG